MCGCSWKVLLCLWPPVCMVFPNHDVVVFQPWIGTAPYLGYVANYTYYYNSPAPPVLNNFLNIFISPFYSTASWSVAFFLVALYLAPATHILSRHKALSTWTSPTPTTLHPPPLVSAPRTVWLPLCHTYVLSNSLTLGWFQHSYILTRSTLIPDKNISPTCVFATS